MNPEIIEQVQSAWALRLRDGYGQTETTAQVGNSPGLAVKPGSMRLPLPGYRISPSELESALIEHEAVAEVAVVPSPDPLRLAVPKAYLLLVPGRSADAKLALDILSFARNRLAPYKRVRRIEFVDELPKTISGKIRRVQLRAQEATRHAQGTRGAAEHREEDFPELRQGG